MNVTIKTAIRAQNLVEVDDCGTGAPENFQEKPLLKAGYFFYWHTSEIGSFRSLTNLTLPNKKNPSAGDREYHEKHTKLRNRLNSARNWYLLQQKFSPGILALVPCGEFQIRADK